jgi:hypothetical protein
VGLRLSCATAETELGANGERRARHGPHSLEGAKAVPPASSALEYALDGVGGLAEGSLVFLAGVGSGPNGLV